MAADVRAEERRLPFRLFPSELLPVDPAQYDCAIQDESGQGVALFARAAWGMERTVRIYLAGEERAIGRVSESLANALGHGGWRPSEYRSG